MLIFVFDRLFSDGGNFHAQEAKLFIYQIATAEKQATKFYKTFIKDCNNKFNKLNAEFFKVNVDTETKLNFKEFSHNSVNNRLIFLG